MRRIILAGLAALVTAVTALPALASPITGPDVSSFQHPNGLSIAWSDVKAAGQSFMFVKATQGTYYTNPYYAQDVQQAAQAGLLHGAYEFGDPSQSATLQAEYFANVIGSQNLRGDLPPVLDLEQTGGLSTTQLISWVGQWLSTVQSLTHRVPMIYVSPGFWQSYLGNTHDYSNYPLWDADWTYSCSGTPWLPGGWATWEFWQYTDSGSIKLSNGTSTTSDEDCFNGNLSALDQVGLSAATPFSVSAVPGNASATVSWNAYPNATSYTVSSTAGNTYSEPATATSMTVQNLTNGQPYAFSVTANLSNTTESTGWGTTVVPAIQDEITVTATPEELYPGQVTLTVHVATPAGAPLSGVPVSLAGIWYGQSTPVGQGTGNTDGNGNIAFVHDLGVSASYQASIQASSPYAYTQMVSPWTKVTILPTVSITAATTTTSVGSRVAFTGSVYPSRGNDSVAIQAYFGGVWHYIAYATTGSTGSYATSAYFGVAGSLPTRVLVAANAVHGAGVNSGPTVVVQPATITVTAAANTASPALFSYVRVSGTISPLGAGTPVTLQAWIYGSWHYVGKAIASSTGAYTANVWAGLLGSLPIRVLASANSVHYAGVSPTLAITVKPAGPVVNGVSVSAYVQPTTVALDGIATVRGLVSGGEAGDHVFVQIYMSGIWHTASSVVAVASNGSFAASVACRNAGHWPLRVLLESNTAHPALGSNIFYVTIG